MGVRLGAESQTMKGIWNRSDKSEPDEIFGYDNPAVAAERDRLAKERPADQVAKAPRRAAAFRLIPRGENKVDDEAVATAA